MLLRGLVILMWFICIAAAVVATFQLAIGMPDGTWGATIFWWVVVVVTFYWHRKAKKESIEL